MTDKPAHTGDRRRELRMAANKQIKVILVDGSMALLGTLFDLSLTGARLRVPLKIETGKKVDLIFDDQQQRIRSTVIWHTEAEIGVSFDATASFASLAASGTA